MPVFSFRSALLLILLLVGLLPPARAQDAAPAGAHEDVLPVIEMAPGAFATSAARYFCDPQKCRLPDCQCAQTAPPAGLVGAEVPQFLLLTFDDCVNAYSEADVRRLFDGTLRNPDGRAVPLTYFLSLENCREGNASDPAFVRALAAQGDEMAVHTRTHTTYDTTRVGTWHAEMQAVRTYLADLGLDDAGVGFRAPFVATNAAMYETIGDLDFLYDSSIYEPPFYSPISHGLGAFVWPYTLDVWGAAREQRAQNCEQFVVYNKCATSPKPGLWEIPLYLYSASATPLDGAYLGAFDVGNPVYNPGSPSLTNDSLVRVLDLQFNARYNNNRAPMNFYFHTPNLKHDGRRGAYRAILEAALSRGDVWAITMQGLIEWMQAPVPATEMKQWYADYCTRHACAPRVGTAAEATPGPDEADALRLFPNPATGVATAEVVTGAPGATLTVYGLMGHALQHHYLPSSGLQRVRLDLSDLATGLYVVRVKDGPHTRTRKLVRH